MWFDNVTNYVVTIIINKYYYCLKLFSRDVSNNFLSYCSNYLYFTVSTKLQRASKNSQLNWLPSIPQSFDSVEGINRNLRELHWNIHPGQNLLLSKAELQATEVALFLQHKVNRRWYIKYLTANILIHFPILKTPILKIKEVLKKTGYSDFKTELNFNCKFNIAQDI